MCWQWQRIAVTAQKAPSLGAALASKTVTAADQGKFISIDVSSALQTWKSNPSGNFGLALVSASPVPNLRLTSREGGGAPVLTIDGSAVVADNDVTVAPSGGDYTSPIAAANNAFTGDHWCVPASAQALCTIHIASGLYILPQTLTLSRPELVVVGEEKGETVLIAARGVETAVRSAAWKLSDFSILNNQNGTTRAVGLELIDTAADFDFTNRSYERLAITASGAQSNRGFLVNASNTLAKLSAVSVTARGGQEAIAVEALAAGLQLIENSTLEAVEAANSNSGVKQTQAETGTTRIHSSTVTAAGGNIATGLSLGDGTSGIADEVIGSTIIAKGASSASGVSLFTNIRGLLIVDSDIVAQGGTQGIGVGDGSAISEATIDGARISASTIGISLGQPNRPVTAHILRTRVNAGQTALDLGSAKVDVSGSTLAAPSWLVASVDAGATLNISDSVLDGAATYASATVTCSRVYDRSYTLLPASCPAP